MARIDDLIEQRDAMETALGTGLDYIELEVRGRRVKKQASVAILDYLNKEIDKANGVAIRARSGPARNRMESFR